MMFSTFAFISPLEAGIFLVIALVIFGPGKLPDVGKALGKGIREFKSASEGEEKKEEVQPKEEVKIKEDVKIKE